MAFNRNRKTALSRVSARQNWGGTSADSRTFSHMFRNSDTHHFGMVGVNAFTQVVNGKINKPMMYMTMGSGNYMELPGGVSRYAWNLGEGGIPRATITAVDTTVNGTQPGKSGAKIRFALDRPYYHAPALLKTESRDAPMIRLSGYPESESENVHWYEGTLQTSDPMAFIQPEYLQANKTMCDASTSVADEENNIYAGIEFGSDTELSSQIGYFARKFEMTDKAIRLEIENRKSGKPSGQRFNVFGKSTDTAVSTGYVIRNMKNGEMEKVEQGYFVTTVEAMLEERLLMDKEMNAVFGKLETRIDENTGREITVGAGWLEMAREGNYMEYSSDELTLDDFIVGLDNIAYYNLDTDERIFVMKTGEVGLAYFSKLVEREVGASSLVFADSHFLSKADHNGFKNELSYGSQFTEWRGYNGARYIVMHDPSKDNVAYYPDIDPDTGRPYESASFDIFDLGDTEAAPNSTIYNLGSKSNCCYIYEPAYELYHTTGGSYNFDTGAYNDGSQRPSNSKLCSIYRESSGTFEIWDISRTKRIAKV